MGGSQEGSWGPVRGAPGCLPGPTLEAGTGIGAAVVLIRVRDGYRVTAPCPCPLPSDLLQAGFLGSLLDGQLGCLGTVAAGGGSQRSVSVFGLLIAPSGIWFPRGPYKDPQRETQTRWRFQ